MVLGNTQWKLKRCITKYFNHVRKPTKIDETKTDKTVEVDKGKGVEPPKPDDKSDKDKNKPVEPTKKDEKPTTKPTEPVKPPEPTEKPKPSDTPKPSKNITKEEDNKYKPTDKSEKIDNKTSNVNKTDSDNFKKNTTSSFNIFGSILDKIHDEVNRTKRSYELFKKDIKDWYNNKPNATTTTNTTQPIGTSNTTKTNTTTPTKHEETKHEETKQNKTTPIKPTVKPIHYKDETVTLKGDKNIKLTQYDIYKDEGVEIHGLKENENYTLETKIPDYLKENKPVNKVGIFPSAIEYLITFYYNKNTTTNNENNKTIILSRDIEIVDINECILPISNKYHHQCHNAAKCINLKGSYTCQCSDDMNCTSCDGYIHSSNNTIKGIGYINGSGCLDKIPPIIELIGDSYVYDAQCQCGTLKGEIQKPIEQNMCENNNGERCYKAYDNIDGDLTNNVSYKINKINNDTWEIVYTVKDRSGNVGNTTRTVKSVPKDVRDEMKYLKILQEELDKKLSYNQDSVDKHEIIFLGFYCVVSVGVVCILILTGLSRTLCNCFKYIFFPTSLLINRNDFENGVDCYLRLSRFGLIDHATRQSIIKEEWENAIEALNSQVSQE